MMFTFIYYRFGQSANHEFINLFCIAIAICTYFFEQNGPTVAVIIEEGQEAKNSI